MQVTSQQQEMAVLDRQLGHKKEELHLLQGSMVQARADLQEALRLGETEVTEKCNHIRVCLAVVFKSPEVLWIYCEIFSLVPPEMQIWIPESRRPCPISLVVSSRAGLLCAAGPPCFLDVLRFSASVFPMLFLQESLSGNARIWPSCIVQLHATKGLPQLFLDAIYLASEFGDALHISFRTLAFLDHVSVPGLTSPKGANSPLRAGDGSESAFSLCNIQPCP